MNTATTKLDCGHTPTATTGCGTGYATGADGRTYCYECCGENDRADMLADGRITLYLVRAGTRDDAPGIDRTRPHWQVTNWPGTLRFDCLPGVRVSRHGGGFGSQRTDAWFIGPDGKNWHAVNRGNNDIARCTRVKA